MTTLIIAEKPSVAGNIARALKASKPSKDANYYEGNGYIVSYAFGHLYTLSDTADYNPDMSKWNINDYPFIPESFKYKPSMNSKTKEIDPGVKKQLKTLKELFSRADEVINACDGDREGELIFAEIKNNLNYSKPVKRLWITSHTPRDIEKGMNNLKGNMQNLESAGYCRQQLDWMMGINFTVAFTLLAGGEITLKAGRVMLPTLKLIFDREVEISNFNATSFFLLKSIFSDVNGKSYVGTYVGKDGDTRFTSKDLLTCVQTEVEGKVGTIISKEEKESSVNPPKLFSLTDLQGYITSKYDGFTADMVLDTIQALYEKKYLTYPRTASRYLDDSQIDDALSSLNAVIKLPELNIKDISAVKFHTEKRVFDSSKVDSHPAIIPTYITPSRVEVLQDDEQIVYLEVAKRFVSQFMPPVVYNNIELITKVENHDFITRGRVLLSEGWKVLYSQDDCEPDEDDPEQLDPEDTLSANFKQGDNVTAGDTEIKEGITQPPKHYTEKSLLYAMENCGKKVSDETDILKGFTIGTPSTRAETIKKLIETGYILKKGRFLLITEVGAKVAYLFPVKRLLQVEFTGRIEKTLKDIENGQYDSKEFMVKMKAFIIKSVDEMKGGNIPQIKRFQNIIGVCPDCNRKVVETNLSYSCEGTKNKLCKYTIWKDDKFLNSFGKKMTESIARELVDNQEVLLKGLKKKDGDGSFTATLCHSKDEESGYWNYNFRFDKKRGTKKKGKVTLKFKSKSFS